MAIVFNKSDNVKIANSELQGPVLDITLDRDYVLQYLVEFTMNGTQHQRWFKETEISKV